MNGAIFKIWIQQEFVVAVEKHLAASSLLRKAILIPTNVPYHLASEQLKAIKALFLLVNVMSLCQAIDQGIFEALKKKVWDRFLSYLISAVDDCRLHSCFEES